MRLIPVVLLLTACAARPARTDYLCDGVETSCPPEAFVQPGYAPAGVGLPDYRPTEEVSKAPRGTDRRVLPQTPETRREPGLWAGDELKAARLPAAPTSWPDPGILLGTPLPYPIITNTSEDRYFSRQCAYVIGDFRRHVTVDVDALPVLVKRCLAARLYAMCMRWVDRPPVNMEPHFKRMIDASKARASAFEKDACEDEPKSPEADAFLRGLELHLRRIK